MSGGRGAAGNHAYHRHVEAAEQARRVRGMAGRVADTPSRELEQLNQALLGRVEDALIAVCDALDLDAFDRRQDTR
jgi:hypothetical protein